MLRGSEERVNGCLVVERLVNGADGASGGFAGVTRTVCSFREPTALAAGMGGVVVNLRNPWLPPLAGLIGNDGSLSASSPLAATKALIKSIRVNQVLMLAAGDHLAGFDHNDAVGHRQTTGAMCDHDSGTTVQEL